LKRLDAENAHRRTMAKRLRGHLRRQGLCELLVDKLSPEDGRTYYKNPLRPRDDRLLSLGPRLLARALGAELTLAVEPIDPPLPASPLYRPDKVPLARTLRSLLPSIGCHDERPLSGANAAAASCVALPHQVLLGGDPEVEIVPKALERIATHAQSIRAWAEETGRRR
jgi:hypothetical protein